MLKTWSRTDNPPNPSKNAQITMLIVRTLDGMLLTKETPLVNSSNPINIDFINEIFILKNLHIGLNKDVIIFIILLVFNIDIITENITTNPPIVIIVLLAANMLFPKISPKFEILQFLLELLLVVILLFSILLETLLLWKIPSKMPTVIEDNICVINNKIPIVELLNKVIPTVPIIKSGPELLVKANILSPSSLVHAFAFLKLVTIFAPTG